MHNRRSLSENITICLYFFVFLLSFCHWLYHFGLHGKSGNLICQESLMTGLVPEAYQD